MKRPRIDAFAALILTCAGLAGWWNTFAGWQWLAAGCGGALVGVLIGLKGLRGSGLWVPVLLIGAYLTGVVAVATYQVSSRGEAFGAAFSTTLLDAPRSWRLLVGTNPPIESTGAVLWAPYLLALVVATVSTYAAVRAHHPIPPIPAQLILLAGVLITGNGDTRSVVLFGAGFGALCLIWAIERSGRLSPEGPTVPARWSVALPIIAVSAVAAMPLGALALGDANSRLVLREETGAYDVETVVTPLDDFRRFRKQPGNTLSNAWRRSLMTVTGLKPGSRLRFAVLDAYDGTRWVPGADLDPGRSDDRFLLLSANYLSTDGEADVWIDLQRPWNSQWLPIAGSLDAVETSVLGTIPVPLLRFNEATGSLLATRNLGAGDSYRFYATQPETRLSDRAAPYSEVYQPNYRAAKFLTPWVAAVARKGENRIEAVRRAAALMKQRGRYTDGAFGWEQRFLAGQSVARLDDFMNGSHMVGNDEQYAAAMALLATRLGVPARVVVGARVPGTGIVKGHDVFAWVELRVKDGTWRELPRETYESFRAPAPRDPPLPELNLPPTSPATPSPSPRPTAEPTTTPPPADPADPPSLPEIAASHSQDLLWLLVPGVIFAIPGFKVLRRAGRRTASRTSLRFAGGWSELVDRARDLGIDVRRDGTRPSQARSLSIDGAGLLADTADAAIFSGAPPDAAAAEAYWRDVRAARRSLGSAVPLWRRLTAPWSLLSLRR